MTQQKLIALPKDSSLQLTPKLWIAIGLIAYNHHLMTLKPLRLLAGPDAGRSDTTALLSTEGLTPVTRAAVVQIARTLLTPLGLLVSTRRGSLLVEDREATQHQEQIA